MVDLITTKDKHNRDFIGIQVQDNVQIPKIMCILVYNIRNHKLQRSKSLASTLETHILSESKDIKGYVCKKSVMAIIRVPKDKSIDNDKDLLAFLFEWDLLIQKIFVQFRAQKHLKTIAKMALEHPNFLYQHDNELIEEDRCVQQGKSPTDSGFDDDAPVDWLYAEDDSVLHERAVNAIREGINTYIIKLFQEHNQLETSLHELTTFDNQDTLVLHPSSILPTTHTTDHSVHALFNEQITIDPGFNQLYAAH